MSPVKLFHKYRGLSDFTLTSLLRTARVLLPRMVGKQTRYKVTDLPSERTVRYYISRGIMDRPLGKRGTTSLFGYRHLLQLLAIKYLQSQYLPLEKIRIVLAGRSNRELEEILPDGSSGVRGSAAATVITGSGRELPPPPGAEARRSAGGRPRTDDESGGREGVRQWRRYSVAPGVELHLREEHFTPVDEGEVEGWGRSILSILSKSLEDRPEGS